MLLSLVTYLLWHSWVNFYDLVVEPSLAGLAADCPIRILFQTFASFSRSLISARQRERKERTRCGRIGSQEFPAVHQILFYLGSRTLLTARHEFTTQIEN